MLLSQEKVFVGLENAALTVDQINEVIAFMGEPNLPYIADQTGATVTLRGWGSTFLECNGQVSTEPLHIKIE